MAESKAEEFLAHHGVMGMHWGQHKGSPAVTKTPRQSNRATPHQEHLELVEAKRSKTSSLSTAQLKKANNRLQAEQQYKKLNPNTLSKGKKVAVGLIAGIGTGVTLYNQVNSPAGKLAISAGKKAYAKLGTKVAMTIMSVL